MQEATGWPAATSGWRTGALLCGGELLAVRAQQGRFKFNVWIRRQAARRRRLARAKQRFEVVRTLEQDERFEPQRIAGTKGAPFGDCVTFGGLTAP
jgi:hypothetical protein